MIKFTPFVAILFLALTSCDKGESITPANDTLEPASELLTNDNGLIISLLTDDEDDETYYFSGYIFKFSTSGTVTATDSDNSVEGTYSLFRDDGRVELKMSFPNIKNFSELNDDWYLISVNQNTILFDDDGDTLEFQIQ